MKTPAAILRPVAVRSSQRVLCAARRSASLREVTASTATDETVMAVPTAMAKVEATPAQ